MHQINQYREQFNLPFELPVENNFFNSNTMSNEEDFYSISEASFFESIKKLYLNRNNLIKSKDAELIKNLWCRIQTRHAIKNCYHYDDFTERKKSIKNKPEICDLEAEVYKEICESESITDHWSFLRHNPRRPISITNPINDKINDEQDYSQIKILKRFDNNENKLISLHDCSNSVIKSLARYHRVLIFYYHEEKSAQEKIKSIAKDKLDL